jgi:hypothetical protein
VIHSEDELSPGEHCFVHVRSISEHSASLSASPGSDHDGMPRCVHHLQSKIEAVLGPQFELLCQLRRFAMQLFMYVRPCTVCLANTARVRSYARQTVAHRVHSIEMAKENTGFLRIFPNKVRMACSRCLERDSKSFHQGALCARLFVDATSIAFFSCHLTAHEGADHREKRNRR